MFALIIPIIAIALISGILYIGINYINIDYYNSQIEEATVNNDLYTYNALISSYKDAYNIYPSNADWENDLRKLKGNLPRNDDNHYTYEYDMTNYRIGVCYSKLLNEEEYQAIKTIHSRGITVLSTDCFELADKTIDDASFPVSVSLTHWIKR